MYGNWKNEVYLQDKMSRFRASHSTRRFCGPIRKDSPSGPKAVTFWDILQQYNKALKCEFWEGLVAKRNYSIYPRQNRSHDIEFPFWMKHRWAF